METKKKKNSQAPRFELTVSRIVEDVVGCKWSLAVLGMIRKGVRRPGLMRRAVPGLSDKVLTERLHKLVRYGIVGRKVYPEVPPRVEYRLTAFGTRFASLLDAVERLDRDWRADREKQ
jgi:DNA-binding HxlR family transcriptional regulator